MEENKITFEEHLKLGEHLSTIRVKLMDKVTYMSKKRREGGIGKTRARFSLEQIALNSIEHVMDEMDNIVCRDYPDKMSAARVYYPAQTQKAHDF